MAEALGYGRTADAIRQHVKEEDKLTRCFADSGQNRQMYIINESGLYALIFGSKLESAKRFKYWVTSEVLPAIHRHGAYMTEDTLEKALTSPDFLIQLAMKLKEEQEKNKALTEDNARMKPSLQYEEYYWTQIQKKVAKGSDAWYDAQKKITDLQKKKQQELLSASQTALDSYKTYYKVSEYAEVQYWHIVRQQFKEGTAERIEADQKYFEAKQAYNDKLIELNEEYVKNCDDVKDELKEQTEELRQTYDDAVKQRAESIYSSFGLFDEFYSESDSGAVLLNNLKNQVAGYADWELQLAELQKKGIKEGLLEELQEMGPQASASLHALNSLTEEQLKEYQELWQKKHDLAQNQSIKENEDLRKETEEEIKKLTNEAKKEIEGFREAYLEAVAEVKKTIEQPLKNIATNTKKIGEDVIAQLIAGIKTGATENDYTVELQKSTGSVTEALKDIPKETKLIGEDALKELLDGLTDKEKIEVQAKKMIDQLAQSIQNAAAENDILRNAFNFYKEQENEELSKQIRAVNANFDTAASIDMLNSITSQENFKATTISKNDFSGLVSQINDLLSAYLPEIAAQKQIVLDSGELVGATSASFSHVLAMSTRRRR